MESANKESANKEIANKHAKDKAIAEREKLHNQLWILLGLSFLLTLFFYMIMIQLNPYPAPKTVWRVVRT